ncbi:acetyltransferase, partial [Colletotrichum chrysophilum]
RIHATNRLAYLPSSQKDHPRLKPTSHLPLLTNLTLSSKSSSNKSPRQNMTKITIRDASTAEDDVAFIVAAFDSTLAPLTALGSGAMWGTTPFSQKDGFVEETIKDVRTSERYQATGEGEEALRIFVAEAELEDGTEAGAG